jgi:hypothetical protein
MTLPDTLKSACPLAIFPDRKKAIKNNMIRQRNFFMVQK